MPERKSKKQREKERFGKMIEQLPALSAEEFCMCYDLANAGATYKMPMESPAARAFTIEMEDGPHEYRLVDRPLARATKALWDHFGDRSQECHSAFYRILALVRVFNDPRARDWTREADGSRGERIHPAIVRAASSAPLNRNGEFRSLDEFFDLVTKEASGMSPVEVLDD